MLSQDFHHLYALLNSIISVRICFASLGHSQRETLHLNLRVRGLVGKFLKIKPIKKKMVCDIIKFSSEL